VTAFEALGARAGTLATSPGLGHAPTPAPGGEPLGRRRMTAEIWLLLGVSLGMSGLFALIRFIGDITAGPVRSQVALLNGSAAPGRPWLDLTLQLAGLLANIVPVFLALHLLTRHGGGARMIGLDRRRVARDIALGAALAAGVGGIGLGLYLLAWHSGANLTVAPSGLPAVWWRIPVLLLSAAQNAVTEEVIVAGYLLVRLRELGWGPRRSLTASALLRGSYHLYQGLGGFFGNVAMGVLFGWLFQRRGRVLPLIVAHTLIDSVAFVGYVLLAGHVSWLPTPG
jgi:membrane protease YdiL (CAAX protease family)